MLPPRCSSPNRSLARPGGAGIRPGRGHVGRAEGRGAGRAPLGSLLRPHSSGSELRASRAEAAARMLEVHIPSVGPEAEAPRQSPEKSHMVSGSNGLEGARGPAVPSAMGMPRAMGIPRPGLGGPRAADGHGALGFASPAGGGPDSRGAESRSSPLPPRVWGTWEDPRGAAALQAALCLRRGGWAAVRRGASRTRLLLPPRRCSEWKCGTAGAGTPCRGATASSTRCTSG